MSARCDCCGQEKLTLTEVAILAAARGGYERLGKIQAELQSAEAKLAVMAERLTRIQDRLCTSVMTDDLFCPCCRQIRSIAELSKLPERAQRLQEFLEAMKEAADPTSTRSPNYMWAKWRAYQGDSDG